MKITKEEIRSFIPNVLHEVEGEELLSDKMLPWIQFAESWLYEHIIGRGFELPEELERNAMKIIVNKAYALAIPSLDLSLTPAGFSVVNTEGRAPASKERVERLIKSLNDFVDANLPPFLISLSKIEEWRKTGRASFWFSTFMYGLYDAQDMRREEDLLTNYMKMREIALQFQTDIAHEYLGKDVIRELLGAAYTEEPESQKYIIWQMVHRAELRYVASHLLSDKIKCPDEHELWHLMQPIILQIRNSPELFDMWNAEMGDQFDVRPFQNKKKGGYFFS